MMNLEEIKTEIAALSPEEQRRVMRFLGTCLEESDAKKPSAPKSPTEEMDAWADAVTGPERFKDGR